METATKNTYYQFQKWSLEDVFTFDSGHICRSEPKELQKFHLVEEIDTRVLLMILEVSDEENFQVYRLEGSVGDPPIPGKYSC